MSPLTVRYVRRSADAPAQADNVVIFDRASDAAIAELKRRIDLGEVDEVVLVGPGVTHGWRIYTHERDVAFIFPDYVGAEHIQASHRITSLRSPLWGRKK